MTKITNKDLAVMMKEGFDEIHDKFSTKEEVNHGFSEIHDKFSTKEYLDKKINEVLVQGDQTAKLMKDSYDELAASTGARIRQEDKIDKNKDLLNNHETRIKKLELSPA